MTEILTQAYNPSTGVYETIDREHGTADDLESAELTAADLGCEPGTEYRLVLVDAEDRELALRIVTATGPSSPQAMQRYELDAYLGDAADQLTDTQKDDLLRTADDIDATYDEEDDRAVAFSAAVQYVFGDLDADDVGAALTGARVAEREAYVTARQVAVMAVRDGAEEAPLARALGVDRMTVRKWLGKR